MPLPLWAQRALSLAVGACALVPIWLTFVFLKSRRQLQAAESDLESLLRQQALLEQRIAASVRATTATNPKPSPTAESWPSLSQAPPPAQPATADPPPGLHRRPSWAEIAAHSEQQELPSGTNSSSAAIPLLPPAGTKSFSSLSAAAAAAEAMDGPLSNAVADAAAAALSPAASELQPEQPWDETKLVQEYAVVEEMNESGLVASKKKTLVMDHAKGTHKQVYQMEDVTLVMEPTPPAASPFMFVVLDGHGGNKCALAAKAELPALAAPYLDSLSPAGVDFAALIPKLDEKLRERKVVNKKHEELDEFDSEGSTLTCACVWRADGRRYLQAANVGDSNAVLVRARSATVLSKEHKVSDEEERARLIASGMKLKEGITRLPGLGLALSRMLGDYFAKITYPESVNCKPYVHSVVEVERGDVLIVASDGLWDCVTPGRAAEIVCASSTMSEAAHALVKASLSDRTCHDNISVIAVRL